jgi:hypothetical protein
MDEVLKPLQSSHTASGKEGQGSSSKLTEVEQEQKEKEGNQKSEEERSEKTIQNRESSVGGES